MTATFDIGALTLGEVFTSGKGSKSVPVSYGGRTITWTPDFQKVAFEPSAFNGEDVARVNLVMNATSEVNDTLCDLDERLCILAAESSAKIFGKTLTLLEVQQRFTSSIKVSEKGYESTFKCKINLAGRGEVQCWDLAKAKRSQPTAWIRCTVQPKITLKNLWIMGKTWGCLYECGNLLIDEVGEECPF